MHKAAVHSGTKTYFFSGDEYIRVTRGYKGPGKIDAGYPAKISVGWNWGDFGKNGIDAALYSGTKTYFFHGPEYIRVTRGDKGPGKVDAGYPAKITDGWNWGGWGRYGIDAALHSGTKTYFFFGDEYIRVTRGDKGPGTVDPNYPAKISVGWNWGDFGKSGIDAALYSGTEPVIDSGIVVGRLNSEMKAYFFSGDEYIRVTRGDKGPGKVDPNYPAKISNWKWAKGFEHSWIAEG